MSDGITGGDDVVPASAPLGGVPLPGMEAISIEATAYGYQGQTPLHILMAECERVLPGSAERLLTLAEESARAAVAMQQKAVDASIDVTKSGQQSASAVAFISVIGAIVLMATGHVAGAALIGVPVVLLVRAFLQRNDPPPDVPSS